MVHSLILKLSSDVFAGMVNIPKPHASSEEQAENANVVHLEEDRDIIKDLLDVIYPRRPMLDIRNQSISYISRFAEAADKYDILDAVQNLRHMLTLNVAEFPGTFLEKYVLACSYGWKDEARHLSQFCPPYNTQLHRETFKSLSSVSLLDLLDLHQTRKEMMMSALHISYQTTIADEIRLKTLRWECLGLHGALSSTSQACRSLNHDKGLWHLLKFHVLAELEKRSPVEARSRLGEGGGFWNERSLNPVWEDECNKCSTKFFTRGVLEREFGRIVERMPMTIE